MLLTASKSSVKCFWLVSLLIILKYNFTTLRNFPIPFKFNNFPVYHSLVYHFSKIKFRQLLKMYYRPLLLSLGRYFFVATRGIYQNIGNFLCTHQFFNFKPGLISLYQKIQSQVLLESKQSQGILESKQNFVTVIAGYRFLM